MVAGLILLEHSVNHLIKLDLPVNLTKIYLNELLGNDDISIPHVINRQGDHFPLIHISLGQNRQGIRYVWSSLVHKICHYMKFRPRDSVGLRIGGVVVVYLSW